MGHIDDHSDPLHLLQKSKALFLQPPFRLRIKLKLFAAFSFWRTVWEAQLIFIIPDERHHSDPQAVQTAQLCQTSSADAALLYRKHCRHLSQFPVSFNIAKAFYHTYPVRIFFHFQIKEIAEPYERLQRIRITLQVYKYCKILQ